MDAKIKADVINAVATTWDTFVGMEGLNIATIGLAFINSPFTKSKPRGEFELIAMFQSASGKRDGRQGKFYFPPKNKLERGLLRKKLGDSRKSTPKHKKQMKPHHK